MPIVIGSNAGAAATLAIAESSGTEVGKTIKTNADWENIRQGLDKAVSTGIGIYLSDRDRKMDQDNRIALMNQAAGISKAEQARMDAANIPLRQGPSMELLINLADSGREDRREYYGRLLVQALNVTGPLIHERPAQGDFVYTAAPNKMLNFGHNTYGYLPVKHAFGVLVPAQFLEAIGKDERGSEFPRGVPFVMLPKINP